MAPHAGTVGYVFVSYAAEDREAARQLAGALTDRGYAVWWDRDISGGALWSEAIEQALADARAVIVIWSAAAAASSFVRAEARAASHRQILIPTMIERCELPMPFGEYQTIDLVSWRGGDDNVALTQLDQALSRCLRGPAVSNEPLDLAPRGPAPRSLPARSPLSTLVTTYWMDLIAMATGPKAFLHSRWNDPNLSTRAARFFVVTLVIRLALDVPLALKIHSPLQFELAGAFIFQPIRMVAIGAVVYLMWRAVGGLAAASNFMGAYIYAYSLMAFLFSCAQVLAVGLMRTINPAMTDAIFLGMSKGGAWPTVAQAVADYPIMSVFLLALTTSPLFGIPFATWGVFREHNRVSRARSALAALLSIVAATAAYGLVVFLSYFSIGPG